MDSTLKTESMKWFSEARFGMFVHWGLYAITGRDMWYYSREEVDKTVYEKLFDRFNPTDYDPREWARQARKAGMKYAVFTTKHHDGFCLFNSEHTDFKVTNTPYGKDLLHPWLDAFRAEGLKVGVYYSLIDWHHPHFTPDRIHPQRKFTDEMNKTRDFSKYVDFLHNQVRELMTNYGKIDIFWADFSYPPDPAKGCEGKHAPHWQSVELKAMIEKLQPGILVNNRLGIPGEIAADFTTPEQYIPKEDVTHTDKDAPMWEACETIGGAWGYYRADHNVKSTAHLIADLVTCVSNNGNLLLNVGPTPRGRIQPEFNERLEQIGKWMDTYGESIYEAGKAECPSVRDGCPEIDFVFTQKGDDLYLHFFDRYPPHQIVLPSIGDREVAYAEFVSDMTDVPFKLMEIDRIQRVCLDLPIIDPDPYDTVVRIRLKPRAHAGQ